MIKKIYVFGVLLAHLTLVNASELSVSSSKNSEVYIPIEWIALIILSLTGFIFIYRRAQQIKEIKELQKKLNKDQTNVSHELNIIGGKDA